MARVSGWKTPSAISQTTTSVPTVGTGGDQRAEPGLDPRPRHVEGRAHAGIGEVQRLDPGILEGMQIAEGPGSRRLDGHGPVAGAPQAQGQGCGRRGLARVHRRTEDPDHGRARRQGPCRQRMVGQVQRAPVRAQDPAQRAQTGRRGHRLMRGLDPADNSAPGDQIGPGPVQMRRAEKLVRRRARTQHRHDPVADEQLGRPAAGQMQLAVLAQAHHLGQDQVARDRRRQVRPQADRVGLRHPTGREGPFRRAQIAGRCVRLGLQNIFRCPCADPAPCRREQNDTPATAIPPPGLPQTGIRASGAPLRRFFAPPRTGFP